jgi:cell division protein ZapA
MPDVTVTIGGRDFTVACQDGEEPFLRTAATMLDQEASALVEQIGRLPESRMLLMAGLMLADRTASWEERARAAEARLAEQEGKAAEAAVDPATLQRLADLAAQAEAMAEEAESRTG